MTGYKLHFWKKYDSGLHLAASEENPTKILEFSMQLVFGGQNCAGQDFVQCSAFRK
jgi:hypothetical protein